MPLNSAFSIKAIRFQKLAGSLGCLAFLGGTLATVREVFVFERVFFNQPLAFTPAILETNGIQDLARRDGFINDT